MVFDFQVFSPQKGECEDSEESPRVAWSEESPRPTLIYLIIYAALFKDNLKDYHKMIQEDLILLNIDSRCKGTYTWQRGAVLLITEKSRKGPKRTEKGRKEPKRTGKGPKRIG